MIKAPIICVEGNDVAVFASQEDAEGWIEPVFAKEGDTYDSEGHLLIMGVGFKERNRSFLGFKWKRAYESTIIRENDTTVDCSAELRDRLVAYLIYNGAHANELQNVPLKELITRVGEFMPWRKKFTTSSK
jgi:hypothetical protein